MSHEVEFLGNLWRKVFVTGFSLEKGRGLPWFPKLALLLPPVENPPPVNRNHVIASPFLSGKCKLAMSGLVLSFLFLSVAFSASQLTAGNCEKSRLS